MQIERNQIVPSTTVHIREFYLENTRNDQLLVSIVTRGGGHRDAWSINCHPIYGGNWLFGWRSILWPEIRREVEELCLAIEARTHETRIFDFRAKLELFARLEVEPGREKVSNNRNRPELSRSLLVTVATPSFSFVDSLNTKRLTLAARIRYCSNDDIDSILNNNIVTLFGQT